MSLASSPATGTGTPSPRNLKSAIYWNDKSGVEPETSEVQTYCICEVALTTATFSRLMSEEVKLRVMDTVQIKDLVGCAAAVVDTRASAPILS